MAGAVGLEPTPTALETVCPDLKSGMLTITLSPYKKTIIRRLLVRSLMKCFLVLFHTNQNKRHNNTPSIHLYCEIDLRKLFRKVNKE